MNLCHSLVSCSDPLSSWTSWGGRWGLFLDQNSSKISLGNISFFVQLRGWLLNSVLFLLSSGHRENVVSIGCTNCIKINFTGGEGFIFGNS